MTWRTSITPTSFDYSTNVWQKKHEKTESKSEKCSGEKLSKVRLTDIAAANAVGDKIPMLVTGETQKWRGFKNVKFLHCQYQHQKKKKEKLDGCGNVWRVGARIRPKIFIRRKKCGTSKRLLSRTSTYRKFKSNLVFLTTKHHTNNTAYGSRHSKIIKRIVRIWFKRPSEVERKPMPCQKFRS